MLVDGLPLSTAGGRLPRADPLPPLRPAAAALPRPRLVGRRVELQRLQRRADAADAAAARPRRQELFHRPQRLTPRSRTRRVSEADRQPPTIPGYTLTTRLGSGGYGEVWLAHAPGGLTKAVKFI